MRFFLDISYCGTAFHGWQVQPNAHTVQEEIQKALSTVLQQQTDCVGSGRTDTGVHATQQIAHVDAELDEASLAQLQYRLNGLLPPEISINAIRRVNPGAHARFAAISRTYHYHLHQKKDPFKNGRSYLFPKPIDTAAISQALVLIKSWKNFQAFSKVHTDVNHFNCDIHEIEWKETNDGHLFSVSANRFLRGMVRATVGTLLEVGMGRLDINQLRAILESGDRSKAGRSVPPEGLYLSEVKYPDSVYLED